LSPDDELERGRYERAAQGIEQQDGVDLILTRPFDLMPPPKGFTEEQSLRLFTHYFEKTTAKPAKLMIDCRKGWARKTCNVWMLLFHATHVDPDLDMFLTPVEFDSDIRHDIPMTELLGIWRRA
jgi:hypothetical protein